MGRALSWFYGNLHEVAAEQQYAEPPCYKRQQQWTKVENKAWLQARALDASGLAVDLKRRVQVYMSSPNEVPLIIPPKGGDITNVGNLSIALHAMVARVMAPIVT